MSRRQPVAEGGLFSTPKATFSNETHQLLRGNNACEVVSELCESFYCAVMMQESKLTNFQQRHLTEKLKSTLRIHTNVDENKRMF